MARTNERRDYILWLSGNFLVTGAVKVPTGGGRRSDAACPILLSCPGPLCGGPGGLVRMTSSMTSPVTLENIVPWKVVAFTEYCRAMLHSGGPAEGLQPTGETWLQTQPYHTPHLQQRSRGMLTTACRERKVS